MARLHGGDLVRLPHDRIADVSTEVLVIGSDPAALTAALASRQAGWEVTVVEPRAHLGGQAVYGSGYLWLAGRNETHLNSGRDDYATARNYVDHVIAQYTEASSPGRRHAFLTTIPYLASWLEANGVSLKLTDRPDAYPERPGGARSGRIWVPEPYPVDQLGQMSNVIPEGISCLGGVERWEYRARRLAQGRFAYGGAALVASLLAACQRHQITVWWDRHIDFIVDDDGLMRGVAIESASRSVRLLASRGVIIASGGYSAHPHYRSQFLPAMTLPSWTIGRDSPIGSDLLQAAHDYGWECSGLGNVRWNPVIWDGADSSWDATKALAAEGSILVDSTGRRICNEAGTPSDICKALMSTTRIYGPQALPAWLIVDAHHRKRHPLGPLAAGHVGKAARNSFAFVASNVDDLARQLKMDPSVLHESLERFCSHARRGHDEDYSRGRSAYDRRDGHTLAPVEKFPLTAVRLVPGDQGVKGGLLTDESARVICHGIGVDSMWAIGEAAASLSESYDLADGADLSESMAYALLAARDVTLGAGLSAYQGR